MHVRVLVGVVVVHVRLLVVVVQVVVVAVAEGVVGVVLCKAVKVCFVSCHSLFA